MIQIGDIVEVQMSILLMPTNNHRSKTTLKLHVIGILETKYTDVSTSHQNWISPQLLTNAKEASTCRTTQSNAPVTSTWVLKRKIGYGDEEEQNAGEDEWMDVGTYGGQ